jgi:hypothetical protein
MITILRTIRVGPNVTSAWLRYRITRRRGAGAAVAEDRSRRAA